MAYARVVTRASLQRLGAIVVIVVVGAVLAWQRMGGDGAVPEAQRPEARRPEAQRPEARRPEAQRPEVRRPEVRRPEVRRPEVRAPEASGLPAEARETLERIGRGGPFPYRQDGVVFQNREGRLPSRPRGYYHEYTVPTPGERDRGARRIITGGDPPREYFYTSDHYQSFRKLEGTP